MRTIFETNRWICYVEKRANLDGNNGIKEWHLVLRKVCGNGDTGNRSLNVSSPK